MGRARPVARVDAERREQGGKGRREAGEGDGVDPGDSSGEGVHIRPLEPASFSLFTPQISY